MTRRDKMERTKMVLAMEYIVRHINNEDIIDGWLMNGVADGDITSETEWEDENLEYYYDSNDTFSELMECFLRRMKCAIEDGGLYCNKVVGTIEKGN